MKSNRNSFTYKNYDSKTSTTSIRSPSTNRKEKTSSTPFRTNVKAIFSARSKYIDFVLNCTVYKREADEMIIH